jgi:hypothetical protein
VNPWSTRLSAPSLFNTKVQKGGDLFAEPVPGRWYLGVPCAHCEEMVLFAPDISNGHGNLSFFEADVMVQERCIRGHLTSFRLDEMRRFQWRPRLNS